MFDYCHVRLFGWFDEPRCLIEGGLAYCVRLLSFTPERRRLVFDSEWQLPGVAACCRSRPSADFRPRWLSHRS
jgi:hypothetical protein